MRNFFAAVAVVLVVSATAFTPGTAEAAPPRNEAEASAQVNTWLRAVGVWTAGYDQVSAEQGQLLTVLNEGVHTARAYFDEGRHDEGRAWAAQWGAEQRAKLSSLRTRLAALSPTPPSLKGPGYDLAPVGRDLEALRVLLAKLPVTTAADLDGTEIVCIQVIDVIERAAAGDRTAGGYLVAAYFDLNIAMLETEASSNRVYIPTLEQRVHPRASTLKAAVAIDEGLIAAYRMMRQWDLAKPFDRAAGVAEVRARAASIDAAVKEMAERTRRMSPQRPVGALGEKHDRIVQNYAQILTALTDCAGRLRSIAEAAETGVDFNYESVAEAIEAFFPALDRFAQLDAQQRGLIAE